MGFFRISCSEVLEFQILYPYFLEELRQIAAGFEAASTLGIWNCTRTIAGILVWMIRPPLKEMHKVGVD